jgi:tetratricopeptide (TPR) repeat protein
MDLATQVKTFSEPYAVEPVQRQMWSLSANNPEAMAYGIRGWEDYYRFTPEANARARRLFAEAIRRDPRYAAAYVGMGWTYVTEWSAFWTEDPHSLEQAVEFAQQALTRNASFPPAHALLGYAYLLRKQYAEAVVEGERAIALGPACAECYATLAEIFTYTGRPHQAIQLVEQARLLDPSSATYYAAIAGWAYYLIGQPDLAVWALRQAVLRNPNVWLRRLHLALAYREVGLSGRARAEIREGLKLNSHLSLVALRERLPDQNSGKVENLLAALRQVGLQ